MQAGEASLQATAQRMPREVKVNWLKARSGGLGARAAVYRVSDAGADGDVFASDEGGTSQGADGTDPDAGAATAVSAVPGYPSEGASRLGLQIFSLYQ